MTRICGRWFIQIPSRKYLHASTLRRDAGKRQDARLARIQIVTFDLSSCNATAKLSREVLVTPCGAARTRRDTCFRSRRIWVPRRSRRWSWPQVPPAPRPGPAPAAGRVRAGAGRPAVRADAPAAPAATPAWFPEVRAAVNACMADQSRLCADVVPGNGRIVRCLAGQGGRLSQTCASAMQKASNALVAAGVTINPGLVSQ